MSPLESSWHFQWQASSQTSNKQFALPLKGTFCMIWSMTRAAGGKLSWEHSCKWFTSAAALIGSTLWMRLWMMDSHSFCLSMTGQVAITFIRIYLPGGSERSQSDCMHLLRVKNTTPVSATVVFYTRREEIRKNTIINCCTKHSMGNRNGKYIGSAPYMVSLSAHLLCVRSFTVNFVSLFWPLEKTCKQEKT